MPKTVKERIAVIEGKVDNLSDKIDTKFSELDRRLKLRFETQKQIDARQDCQIKDLGNGKANKKDIDDIKTLLYWVLGAIVIAFVTAVITKTINLW